jgi:hypothetical protein
MMAIGIAGPVKIGVAPIDHPLTVRLNVSGPIAIGVSMLIGICAVLVVISIVIPFALPTPGVIVTIIVMIPIPTPSLMVMVIVMIPIVRGHPQGHRQA